MFTISLDHLILSECDRHKAIKTPTTSNLIKRRNHGGIYLISVHITVIYHFDWPLCCLARTHFVLFIAKITDIFLSLSLSPHFSSFSLLVRCVFMRVAYVYVYSFVCVLLAPLNEIELSKFEFLYFCFDLNRWTP